MHQQSVVNGTPARVRRILAALALLATALVGVVAIPAGPAQAGGPSIVICDFADVMGVRMPVNCVRVPLPQRVDEWPPDDGCLPCFPTLDAELVRDQPDPIVDKVPSLILGGLADLGQAAVATNDNDRDGWRAAALQSFESVVSLLDKGSYQPGTSLLYDPQSGKTFSYAMPWLDAANKDVAAGLASLQAGEVPQAVAQFDAAYADIAGQ